MASNTASRGSSRYPTTAEEIAVALREQREKCRTLHEARSEAWNAMRQASGEHEFLVDACREADRETANLLARLERVCRERAYELAS